MSNLVEIALHISTLRRVWRAPDGRSAAIDRVTPRRYSRHTVSFSWEGCPLAAKSGGMAGNMAPQPAGTPDAGTPDTGPVPGAPPGHNPRQRVPVQAALEQALKLYNAGRLPMALRISQQIVERQP